MDGSLYPRLHPSCKLSHPTGCLCLRPRHPQQEFCHHPTPGLPHSDRPDTGLFIQNNQPAAHQGPIGGPWRPPISQPLHKVPENQPKFPAGCSKPQEPVLEQHRVCPAWSGPSRESPATDVTVSSVMSTGVRSGGRSGYESRLAAVGVWASGCLARSTSITLSPVFVHRSPGWRTTPVSR